MSGLTAFELARVQFGFTISFHIIFPAITIGLASYLTVLEAAWLRTQDAVSAHGATQLGITLVLFVVIYFAVFGTGIGYLLRLIRVGPRPHEGESVEHGGPGQERTPARPMSAAHLEQQAQGGHSHGY